MKYPNFREEKKLWKRGYKRVACLDEAGRGCEKPDAEVLTNNGWKFYFDITQEDKVLSYTDDGYIRWQGLEKVIEKDFEGNLIELKNRGIDIIITPDHYFTVIRRVFKRNKKDNNRLKLVGYKTRKERKLVTDLLDNDLVPRGGKWKGINKEYFKLPKIERYEEKLIDIKLWVAFFGIFLAEGSVSCDKKRGSYRITISQNENAPLNRYKKIYCLLKKLPFKFNQFKTGFTCYNKPLYTYLKQFGDSYNKFIPKDIKELSSGLLNILVDWMILGDGCCYISKNRKKVCIYYTVSKKLKDDFEEILLKAGWTFHTNTKIPKDTFIGRRILKKENKVPCFETRLRRNNKVQVKSLHKKEVFYKGKVFCLRLPKYHNFYVRRNGTGYFTGNSLAGPVTAAAVVIKKFSIFKGPTKIEEKRVGSVQFSKIKDSKKLTPKKREEFFKILTKHPNIKWGVGRVSEKAIDKINIKNAAELAMEKALWKLKVKSSKPSARAKLGAGPVPHRNKVSGAGLKVDFLIIDGNNIKNLKLKSYNFKLIVKADEKVFSCAIASIIAKVTRDRIMGRLHKKYPKYGFNRHKGYPTKYHIKMLKKYGPCKIHRKSFGPVKACPPKISKKFRRACTKKRFLLI